MVGVTLAPLEIGGLEIARQCVGRVVQWPWMRHRPDDGASIENLGRLRQQFVDPDTGQLGGDAPKLTSDLIGSGWFRIQRVQLTPRTVDV